MGKKSSTQTTKTESKTENNPWAPAQDQLKDILNLAQQQYEKTGGLDGQWFEREFPDLTQEMRDSLANMASSGKLEEVANNINQITSGAAGNVNNAGDVLGALSKGGITGDQINDLASQLYDSETVKSQTEQLGKDVDYALQGQIKDLNQQAGATGNMGSSRAGVAQGVMSGKANEALAKGTADIQNNARNQAYGQALGTLQGNQGTNLAAAGALGNLGMNQGQLQAGNSNIYQQMMQNQFNSGNYGQNHLNQQAQNDWFNKVGQGNAGWDNLSKYLGMVGSVGGMGGTSNSSGTNTAQVGGGGGFGNTFNQMLGAGSAIAGIGGQGGFGWWSDASMKKNVKKKGKTKDGVTKYDWEWNEKGKSKGMKGKASGVLAQQVEKEKPNTTKKDIKSGALTVDYDALGVDPKNSKKK